MTTGGVVKEMGSSVKSSDMEMRGCATAILLPTTLRNSFSNSINRHNIRQRPALRLRYVVLYWKRIIW